MSTTEGSVPEPPFSEMISRWLDDGDRLSEGVPAITVDPTGRLLEERESLLSRARGQVERHPGLAAAAVIAAFFVGVTSLRLLARSYLGASRDDAAAAPLPGPASPLSGSAASAVASRPTTPPAAAT